MRTRGGKSDVLINEGVMLCTNEDVYILVFGEVVVQNQTRGIT